MKKIDTEITGVYIIENDIHFDNRGWFTENYSKIKYELLGIDNEFCQDNTSFSSQKGTIRGLHLQIGPFAQAKLVTCLKGSIFDVIVDLRLNSRTYKKWISIILNKDNLNHQIFIPKGCAHGFMTLEDNTLIMYKVDSYYSKEHERTIRYNDPDLNIHWEVDTPIVSEKDQKAPLLSDLKWDELE